MLSPDQVGSFRAAGWITVASVFSTEQAQELSQVSKAISESHLENAVNSVAESHSLTPLDARTVIGRAISGDRSAQATVKASASARSSLPGTVMRAAADDSRQLGHVARQADTATGLGLSTGAAGFAVDDFDVSTQDEAKIFPRKVNDPYAQDERYRAIVHDPGLRALAEQLIGKPCRVYGSQVFIKYQGLGAEKPFHQDNFYFQIKDCADVLTCWCALDDASVENGCMQMVPGSHQRGIVNHDAHPQRETHLVAQMTDEDRASATPAPVRAGGIVCWSGAMLHGSSENTSPHGRCAYAIHFVASDCELLPGAPPTDFERYESVAKL